MFDTVDNLKLCMETLIGMISTMKVNGGRMEKLAASGFSTATDATDYLVKKGVPFREAHKVVGQMVKYCISNNLDFGDVELEKFKNFSPLFDEDIFEVLKIRNSVESRKSYGGTSSQSVKEQFKVAERMLADEENWLRTA